MVEDKAQLLARWRLALGKEAEEHHINCDGHQDMQRIEGLIGFLFNEGESSQRSDSKKSGGAKKGGTGASSLTIPQWIDGVSELFPRSSKEIMERELVKRRGINELLEQPELLEKIEPNIELVKTLISHKDLMNPKTRILARKIIESVVNQLKEKMKLQVETAITGAIRRDKHSPRRVFRNLDLNMTVRRNLKNFDPESGKLLVDQLFFFASERNKKPWHIIIAVDQSGSMLDSAIFSTIMAAIFYELPSVKTSLFLFDTQIVDLSSELGQPVDVLMNIQLGGGTDIHKAMQYAAELIREPQRTIVVLISDFYEGGNEKGLIRQSLLMAESGVRTIGLGALGYDARPDYCAATAKKLKKVGMDILVCTPEKLSECMAQIISH
ncbi:MAG: VWA domain-containing protein [Methylococcales bacterium]|nr:VWA domain-containing protein [Methylococcales bacterium]